MARYKNKTQLINEYKRLAAAADNRLQRWEKLAQQKDFAVVKKWSYARAMQDIKKWRGEGRKRFGQTPPRTVQGIKAKMRDIRTFMESPTSQKKTIIEIYKKRAQTYKERYGINADWQTMAVFFERNYYQSIFKRYGSKTAMKMIGEISRNEKEIKEAIQKSNTEELYLTDDKAVQDRISDFLKRYEGELRVVGFDI